jgi:hypothetical protein
MEKSARENNACIDLIYLSVLTCKVEKVKRQFVQVYDKSSTPHEDFLPGDS